MLGVYIRIAILYYKIWKNDTNYCLLYANVLGSFIMGLTVKHKDYLYTNSKFETTKVLYVSITTGLCGSLTSFSGWMLIANNNLLLQFDSTSSPFGGRFWEFCISLIAGISVPLASLKFGYFVSTLSSYSNNENSQVIELELDNGQIQEETIPICSEKIKVIFLIFLVITCILLVIILPMMIDDTWIYLTYTALLGILGAYCRYMLSFSNTDYPKFPIGTFIANVVGTALAAVFLMLEKFYISYYNVKTLAIFFALIQGFCGCLTTVSTLVVELDSLTPIDSYKYTLATHIASQLLVIFIRDIYSFQTIDMRKINSRQSINVCEKHNVLCGNLLSRINCTQPIVESCKGTSDYNSYWGQCSCGKFSSTTAIAEKIIDSQLAFNVSNNLINVWPVDAFSVDAVTEVFDFCLTYENLCTNLLDRMGCPQHQRSINACGRMGILYDKNTCSCGTFKASNRIEELITDHALFRRYDMIPYLGYITMPTIRFDLVYLDLCDRILEHIQCPQDKRFIVATTTTGDYSSWVGTCSCGKYYNVNSVRIKEVIFHSMTKNVIQKLIVGDPNTKIKDIKGLFDLCSSFANVCSYWLKVMECPQSLQYNIPCGQQIINGIGIGTTGNLVDFTGTCNCGEVSFSSSSLEAIINVITMEDISTIINIPAPNQPYITMVSSDPFLQLTQP